MAGDAGGWYPRLRVRFPAWLAFPHRLEGRLALGRDWKGAGVVASLLTCEGVQVGHLACALYAWLQEDPNNKVYQLKLRLSWYLYARTFMLCFCSSKRRHLVPLLLKSSPWLR